MFQYPIDVTKPVERLYTTTGRSVLPQGKIFKNNSEYKGNSSRTTSDYWQ